MNGGIFNETYEREIKQILADHNHYGFMYKSLCFKEGNSVWKFVSTYPTIGNVYLLGYKLSGVLHNLKKYEGDLKIVHNLYTRIPSIDYIIYFYTNEKDLIESGRRKKYEIRKPW